MSARNMIRNSRIASIVFGVILMATALQTSLPWWIVVPAIEAQISFAIALVYYAYTGID